MRYPIFKIIAFLVLLLLLNYIVDFMMFLAGLSPELYKKVYPIISFIILCFFILVLCLFIFRWLHALIKKYFFNKDAKPLNSFYLILKSFAIIIVTTMVLDAASPVFLSRFFYGCGVNAYQRGDYDGALKQFALCAKMYPQSSAVKDSQFFIKKISDIKKKMGNLPSHIKK